MNQTAEFWFMTSEYTVDVIRSCPHVMVSSVVVQMHSFSLAGSLLSLNLLRQAVSELWYKARIHWWRNQATPICDVVISRVPKCTAWYFLAVCQICIQSDKPSPSYDILPEYTADVIRPRPLVMSLLMVAQIFILSPCEVWSQYDKPFPSYDM